MSRVLLRGTAVSIGERLRSLLQKQVKFSASFVANCEAVWISCAPYHEGAGEVYPPSRYDTSTLPCRARRGGKRNQRDSRDRNSSERNSRKIERAFFDLSESLP
jgi:hypothetical protein